MFDDSGTVLQNRSIRQLWPPWPALTPPSGRGQTVEGRPALHFSFALNYAISGSARWSYQALNLAIHVFNGFLLFLIVRGTLLLGIKQDSEQRPRTSEVVHHRAARTSRATMLALIVSLVWALHPIQTQAVTYISQRAESMAALFILLVLYGTMRAGTTERPRRWMLLAMAGCWLGMLTKEVVVAAPVLALAYDRIYLASSWRQVFAHRRTMHIGIAAGLLLLVLLVLGHRGRGGTVGFDITALDYGVTQAWAITHYLRLCFWPDCLAFDYGNMLVAPHDAAWQLLVVGLVMIATAGSLRACPRFGFLWLGIIVVLLPTSSFVPILTQTVSEHRMYLPLAAVVTCSVLLVHSLCCRLASFLRVTTPTRQGVLLAAVVPLLVTYGVLTYDRNHDYRSRLSLWTDTVAKRPDNARARCNLGLQLLLADRLAEAEVHLKRGQLLDPTQPLLYHNRALVFRRRGCLEEAIDQHCRAIARAPHVAEMYASRARTYRELGLLERAVADYRKAIELNPGYRDAYYGLAAILHDLNNS